MTNDNTKIDLRTSVRMRPSMYVGSIDDRGLMALFREALDFSLEEFRNGHATRIAVTLHRDQSISIRDDGNGLDSTPASPATAFERFLTDPMWPVRRNGVWISSHCLGLWIVNPLSSSFFAESRIGGQRGRIRYECGQCVEPLLVEPYDGEDGFHVHFRFDETIFTGAHFDAATLRQTVWEQAALHPGVRITFIDEAAGTVERFRSSEGVMTLLREECRDKATVWPEPLRMEMQQGRFRYDLAIHCVQADCFSYSAFANGAQTRQGGAHVVATRDAVAVVLRRLVKSESIEKVSWPLEKLLRGIVVAIAVDVPDAMFEGPTKEKLANHEIEISIREFVTHSLANLLARKLDHLRLWREWLTADSSSA